MLQSIREMKLKTALALLPVLFTLCAVVFGYVTQTTIRTVKVHGPHYEVIVAGKDLVADALPPPLFVIEAYYTAVTIEHMPSNPERKVLLEKFYSLETDFKSRMQFWSAQLSDGEVRKLLVGDVKTTAEEIFLVFNSEILPSVMRGDKPDTRVAKLEHMHDVFLKHRVAIEKLATLQTADSKNVEDRVTKLMETREWMTFAFGAAMLFVVLLASWWMRNQALEQQKKEAIAAQEVSEAHKREGERSERLQKDVEAMLRVVNAASHGDLTQQISVKGSDAIGQMGDGLQRFFEELRNSIGSIAANADVLTDASSALSSVSSEMTSTAQNTAQQANAVSAASEQLSSNVQTVAAGTEEMSASIREIARNAAEASKVAREAVDLASTTNTTVSKLDESSSEIGKVIKVITGIAQQTKMLALNATVEAARAGEAGKGFAVVANEVKELAKETAKATEDISRKIDAIQTDSKEAVSAIGQIGDIIRKISEIQTTIAAAVEEQTATTNEMSRNVNEGATGTNEIAKNITGVARSAQEATVGAKKSAESAQKLSEMANELRRLVSRYKAA